MNYFEYIYNRIDKFAGLKFYPLDAVQEVPAPFGIIEITDISPIDGIGTATAGDIVEFTVIIQHAELDQAQALSTDVRTLLDKKCDAVILQCNFEGSSFTFDTDQRAYVQINNYYSRMKLQGIKRNYSPLHYNITQYST